MKEGSIAGTKLATTVITDELLQAAIVAKEGRDDVVITKSQISSSDKVSSYCSAVLIVTLTVKVGGIESVHTLFVKTGLEDKLRKERGLGKSPLFQIEAKMYSELIPTMIQFQTEKCGSAFGLSVPDYYYSVVNTDTELVILHNYQPDGYSILNTEQGVDYEHCILVMKEIAAFHALSWAMKNAHFEFPKKYPFLLNHCFTESPVNILFDEAVRAVIELVKIRKPGERVEEAAKKLSSMDIIQTMKRLCQPREPYAVICHGDLHCLNILFENDSISGKKRPERLKIVDLQTAHYALPSTDLAIFFYSSTSRNTRKRHFNDLLRVYHTEFISCLRKLHTEFQEFTFNKLEDLFVQSALFGFLLSCANVPSSLSNMDDPTKSSREIVEKKDYTNNLALLCDVFPAIQERLFDDLIDLVEMGCL